MTDSALLIVDVQIDFCPGGALPVPEGDQVVVPINRLAPIFGVVVATQDWHPAGHVSFASTHPGRAPFDSIDIGDTRQTLWPDHCVAGSPGAALHPALDLTPIDLILRKGTTPQLDSYSGFLENDHRTTTGLAGYLRERSVRSVYVVGLAADVCVRHTAVDAVELGFRTFVVTDATRAVDQPPGNYETSLAVMRSAGITLISSSEIPE